MTKLVVGPVDASIVPRFAGIATFARLPRIEDVGRADVAIVGIPFDSGVSYRPGARFGPAHVREASRLLRALSDKNIVGADVVEVAPAYDHAQLTAVAASHVAYELISAIAPRDTHQATAAPES
ncbi:hypothetical protein GCM10009655_18570 [Rhodoglobus aureus]|uniref:Agmatinase n=1 Tax=Rhodoglobus aureus TaxID=191497 RepID=A0ABP4GAX1_9MICO